MDFYKKRVMISRQGKAINHLNPSYFATPIKRSPPKQPEKFEFSDIDKILNSYSKPNQDSLKSEQAPNLSYSFKAISREKYDFVHRNKTESPKVGAYNPNWEAVRPRSAQSPKISAKRTRPRKKMIFTPLCITKDFNCSYPARTSADSNYNEKLKRTMSNLQTYVERSEEKRKTRAGSAKLSKTVQSFVDFEKQLDRKDSAPDKPQRFTFIERTSGISSKNKHVHGVEFAKTTPRGELFPSKGTLGPYDKDEEKLMWKLNTAQLDMSKMTDRKELVLTHMLKTPHPLSIEEYDKAFFHQSTVRGTFHIPLMATVTPRDDMMYRTTEAYILNIPEIQCAEAKPQYMGETSLKQFKTQLTSTT